MQPSVTGLFWSQGDAGHKNLPGPIPTLQSLHAAALLEVADQDDFPAAGTGLPWRDFRQPLGGSGEGSRQWGVAPAGFDFGEAGCGGGGPAFGGEGGPFREIHQAARGGIEGPEGSLVTRPGTAQEFLRFFPGRGKEAIPLHAGTGIHEDDEAPVFAGV